MRKTKKVTKTETVIETVDLICNKCAKTLNNAQRYYPAKKGKEQEVYIEGLEEVEIHGGYYSKFIGDMTSIRFSLCEECVHELTKTFKIPVDVKGDASSEYVPEPKYEKLVKKQHKESHLEWVKAILKEKAGYKKQVLQKKSHKELHDIYHELQDKKRKAKA